MNEAMIYAGSYLKVTPKDGEEKEFFRTFRDHYYKFNGKQCYVIVSNNQSLSTGKVVQSRDGEDHEYPNQPRVNFPQDVWEFSESVGQVEHRHGTFVVWEK